MEGAREYAKLLGTGTFEKLDFESGSHARGRTFHVWIRNEEGQRTVEVYGIVGGNPGWTESYGWLHSGKWQEDFKKLVISKRMEAEDAACRQEATTLEVEKANKLRTQTLLNAY